MFRRLKLMFMCLVAGLAIGPVHALQAQESQSMQRFRVLIPDFQPLNGANKKFGEKAAEKLRDLINTLPTHQPVSKKDMKASLKKYKMKMEQLDCIRTRQLASQMGAQVALCASYTPGTDGQYTVKASFYNMTTSEPFNLKDVSAQQDKGEEQAAQGIFDQFDRYNQQVRATAFCAQYAQSQQWDAALENCNKALALNPKSAATHYQKAQILFQEKKYEDALAELKTVLTLNPAHDDALKLAGYIAATLGQNEQAEAYYTKYLELNPGSTDVRMKIAYDLAKQGDPAGAMQLIQKGLDVAPNNVDLLEQYGGFAFSAGLAVNQKSNMNGDDPSSLTPEAADYFRKAIDAYQKVYSIKGEATPVAHLRNIIAAYVQLNQVDQAIDMAQKALKTHPKEDGLWSMYADALDRAGRVDAAVAALDSVKKINPEFPNVDLRQGKWLIDAGRVDDAVKVLSTVARADSGQARTAAQLIFGDAYTKGVSKKNWSYAITELAAAARLPNLDVGMTHQLNFWHGWSLFQTGMEEQKPGTVASAKASLPKFQEALKLFQNVGDYPRTAAKLDPKQLLSNTNTYIDIQKAIIKRGSRGG